MLMRRFAPLFWSQFFSAFNDNYVRQMLGMLILFRLGSAQAGAFITLAIAIFILPSIVLSGLGGELADSHDKARVTRWLKGFEILVQMVAATGFWFNSLVLLYLALFGLGTIAALFGPIKYGILPDHLEPSELPAGNALIEAATFLAILLGLVVGGYAAAVGRDPSSVVVQLMLIALICWGASLFIPSTKIAAPNLRIEKNVFASSLRLLKELGSDSRIHIGAICVSWFWTVGAVALSLIPVMVKQRVGGDINVETAISALFAIGIAVGSIAAAWSAKGRINLSWAPAAALTMAIALIDIGVSMGTLPTQNGEVAIGAFLRSMAGLHISLDVIVLSAAGGMFVVPIFAAVQLWALDERRARVIAGVNVLTALYMVGGSLLSSVLLAVGLSEPIVLIALGLANLGIAIWLLPFSHEERQQQP
eukprot:gene9557-9633_t